MAITFGILAGLVSLIAIWVGYMNSQAKDAQQELLNWEISYNGKKEKELEAIIGRIDQLNKKYKTTLLTIDEQFRERDLKQAEKKELDQKLDTVKKEVENLNAKLSDYKKKVPDIGDVDRLIKDLKDAQEAIAKINASIAEIEKENGKLVEEISQQNDRIEYNRKVIDNHTKYQAQGELSAKISSVYKNWGFVVIGAGDQQGVTPRSFLLVKRGEELIGELQVTTSTNNSSTAEIKFDTLKEGDFIQVGDTVVAKPPAADKLPGEKDENKDAS